MPIAQQEEEERLIVLTWNRDLALAYSTAQLTKHAEQSDRDFASEMCEPCMPKVTVPPRSAAPKSRQLTPIMRTLMKPVSTESDSEPSGRSPSHS